MVALVVLAVLVSWALLSITLGLLFCRSIRWARGHEPAMADADVARDPSAPDALRIETSVEA